MKFRLEEIPPDKKKKNLNLNYIPNENHNIVLPTRDPSSREYEIVRTVRFAWLLNEQRANATANQRKNRHSKRVYRTRTVYVTTHCSRTTDVRRLSCLMESLVFPLH